MNSQRAYFINKLNEGFDPYATLNIPKNSSARNIKIAYTSLCLKHHPNKSGNRCANAFKNVNDAYAILTDSSLINYIKFTQSSSRAEANAGPSRRFAGNADSRPNSTNSQLDDAFWKRYWAVKDFLKKY